MVYYNISINYHCISVCRQCNFPYTTGATSGVGAGVPDIFLHVFVGFVLFILSFTFLVTCSDVCFDFRVKRNFYSNLFCREVMFYKCNLYLFMHTVDQHDFHVITKTKKFKCCNLNK